MQRLPLPGPSSLGHNPIAKHQQSSDFALRDILERWAGSDDTLKVVMMAKSEEDRLKQEVMRLEIRRTEMEMLKEAIRAGIQPQLIPQIFGGGGHHQGHPSVYTPTSPSQGSGSTLRMPYPHPQQIPSFNKPGASSTRYLPKLDTANLPHPPGQHPVTANPATTDHHHRHSVSQPSNDAPQTAPPVANGSETEQGSLFFHHWRPPPSQQSQSHGTPTESATAPRHPSASDPPGSPTPRKKKVQQHHLLHPSPSPSSGSARRSPSRGHVRHRSDASGLAPRFNDQYPPPPAPSNNNLFAARMSNDRELPRLLSHQNPTSHEIDAARKRKREQEVDANNASTESSIGEEPANNKDN